MTDAGRGASRDGQPRVGLGMFLYNEERHVAEAIESLLAQTYRHFRLVVVDDASSDGTEEVVRRYAAGDSRIVYVRNPVRLGYAANYQRTFQRGAYGVEYWAWAAGHDRHDPRWLETLVAVLDEHPDVVMAYPRTVRISGSGQDLGIPSPLFDTSGLGARERINALHDHGVGFGNMIYGLFRAQALRRVGVFRRLLVPDVALLWALTLEGAYRQVPEDLWFRRYAGLFSLERQKRTVFARAPWYAHVPYGLVNTVAMGWSTVLSPRAGSLSRRLLGVYLTWIHLRRYGLPSWLRRLYRTVKRNPPTHRRSFGSP